MATKKKTIPETTYDKSKFIRVKINEKDKDPSFKAKLEQGKLKWDHYGIDNEDEGYNYYRILK